MHQRQAGRCAALSPAAGKLARSQESATWASAGTVRKFNLHVGPRICWVNKAAPVVLPGLAL